MSSKEWSYSSSPFPESKITSKEWSHSTSRVLLQHNARPNLNILFTMFGLLKEAMKGQHFRRDHNKHNSVNVGFRSSEILAFNIMETTSKNDTCILFSIKFITILMFSFDRSPYFPREFWKLRLNNKFVLTFLIFFI